MMKRKVLASLTLTFMAMAIVGIWGCSSDDSSASNSNEMCISGTIVAGCDNEESGNCVFIGGLVFPEGDEKYSYIETVVVPKDEFTLHDYKIGDKITFTIVEVKSTYPELYIGYERCTAFLCSIKIGL